MSHVSPALYLTLVDAVPDLYVKCLDPWCLIGSVAALLIGVDTSVADVDVLTSRADAERLQSWWASRFDPAHVPSKAEGFRSRFARFQFSGLPVEVMGGLEVHSAHGWQPVLAGQLRLIGVNGLAVPVPSPIDQIRILESFGRDKDRVRAMALRELMDKPDQNRHV